jgi:hypothetical protein
MLLPNLIPLIDVTFSTPTGHYAQNPFAGGNECFYEKVIKVKADVAAVLNSFRTNQVPLETLVDAIHRCRASIRTLSGPPGPGAL